MDSTTAAARIGTTPKVLRRFLRDRTNLWKPVGSGARYDFREADLGRLREEFIAWNSGRCSAPTVKVRRTRRKVVVTQSDRDRAVWDEEEQQRGGPLILPNIHDPKVRADVRAEARRQEAVLEAQLIAAGLHITQPGWDRRAA